MFESLTERLGGALASIKGKAKLNEENVQQALREVRMALLEADVALPVVRDFIAGVKERALGAEVSKSLSPGQVFIRIVNDELVAIMGAGEGELNLAVQPPAVILMAGLQGTGKTTSTAKLGRFLNQRQKKSVMVASTDVYRPAAIDQLRTLAGQAGLAFFESSADQKPVDIAGAALTEAKKQFTDVLIVDTAGRLGIDEEMMREIRDLYVTLSPVETLFVVDALTGQDAANTARAFSDVLPLTGVLLTKADGDSRGGAALSVRAVTGKPIKFMAVGETIDDLDAFHPDRIASRILGMGDLLSLIEEAEQKVDRKQARKLANKIKKGRGFDLEDFRDQIQQLNNMGGVTRMLDMLPGMGQMAQAAEQKMNAGHLARMEAIINSMTPGERRFPDTVKGSRKKRIANGSGTQIQDVNRLLKEYKQMQKTFKKLGRKGGMDKMMRGMGGMMQPPGGLPGR